MVSGAKQRSWVVNKNASNQRSDEVLAGQSFPVYSKHEKRIEDAVKLPIGEDLNEWVAANSKQGSHPLKI